MKLFRFIFIYIVFVSVLLIILISSFVYTTVESTITQSSQQNIHREISGIQYEYTSFLKANLILLKDYSKASTFTQAVMQPEINKFMISDVIENISFFEQQYDLYLLDFEGEIINIVKNNALNFSNKQWVEKLIDKKISSHQKLIEKNQKFFWELAIAIEYNRNNEGILVVHIPVNSFKKFSKIEERLSGLNIVLKLNDKMIESLGKKVTGEKYIVDISKDMGTLEFTVDTANVTYKINDLFKKLLLMIVILGLMTVLISLYFTKRTIIKPLHHFQEGLLDFFDFVNRKKEHVFDLSIDSNTEVGDMAKVVNENILKTKNSIEKERKIVSEIAKTVDGLSLSSLNNSELIDKNIGDRDLISILEVLTEHSLQLRNLNQQLEIEINKAVEQNLQKDRLLAEQSKLAAMGEMMGSIAHQWRQPLNTLALKVQFLEDDFEDQIIDMNYLQEYSKESMQLINFMSKTIDDFRDFFRTDKEKTDLSVLECIQRPIEMIKPQLDNLEISLDMTGEDFTIEAVSNEIQQVILNIINNAKDAIQENSVENGKIQIELEHNNAHGFIKISDNAGGIPNDVINRIFEPYYTTKEQGKGTGIGLYMSKMIIVDNMKGELKAFNTKEGACFEIELFLK